jgi:hypothetical protein
MISSVFNSSKNYEALKSAIQDSIQEKLQNKSFQMKPYDSMIKETMKYVEKNVSPQVPQGITKDDYIMMMNRKVYTILKPIIEENELKMKTNQRQEMEVPQRKERKEMKREMQSGNRIQPVQQQRNKGMETMFDPILVKDYENIPVIEYPTPSGERKLVEEKMNEKINFVRMERDAIYEKPRHVQFQDEVQEEDKAKVEDRYNELIEAYERQNTSMEGFEDIQKMQNQKIDSYYEKLSTEKERDRNESIFPVQVEMIDHFGTIPKKDVLPYQLKKDESIQKKISNIFEKEIIPEQRNVTYEQKDTKNIEFSPYLNTNLTSVIIPPPQKLVEKSYYITIGSVFRNKKMYPDQNYFEVKFNPASNSYMIDKYVDSHDTLIYSSKTLVYGDDEGATIPITFDNIKQIRVLNVTVPILTSYRGGRAPVVYNGPTPVSGQTDFSQFEAIPTKSTGIQFNVFREPALFLYIPELEHSYYTTSNFGRKGYVKLNPDSGQNQGFVGIYTSLFCNLRPNNITEVYKYDPTLKGKLDKFTMGIYDSKGKLFDFGIDKLFIEKVYPGEMRYGGYCGNQYRTTHVDIKFKDSSYSYYCSRNSVYFEDCDTLNSHPVKPGDLLFFYTTLPQIEDYIFLEDYIKIKNISNVQILGIDYLKIQCNYQKEVQEGDITVLKSYDVIFKDFIPGGNTDIARIYQNYSIILGYQPFGLSGVKYYTMKIVGFANDGGIIVENIQNVDIVTNFERFTKIAWAQNNPQGVNNANPKSLFYNQGFAVIRVGDFNNISDLETENVDQWSLEIDCPWEYISENLVNGNPEFDFSSGDIFFIQQKLQLVYDLEIVSMVKDSSELNSNFQGTGLNF